MTIFGQRQRLWFRGDFDPTAGDECDGRQSDGARTAGSRPAGRSSARTELQQPTTADTGQRHGAQRPIGELYNYSPRANIIGPGAWNTDASLFKNFKFLENGNVRFTADFFNVFNHPNDVNPDYQHGAAEPGCPGQWSSHHSTLAARRVVGLSSEKEWPPSVGALAYRGRFSLCKCMRGEIGFPFRSWL